MRFLCSLLKDVCSNFMNGCLHVSFFVSFSLGFQTHFYFVQCQDHKCSQGPVPECIDKTH